MWSLWASGVCNREVPLYLKHGIHDIANTSLYTSAIWNTMHQYIIPYSCTYRGVLTGLQAGACIVVGYTTGQYLVIALTTVHYGIYCPGGSFDLYIYVIGRIQVLIGRLIMSTRTSLYLSIYLSPTKSTHTACHRTMCTICRFVLRSEGSPPRCFTSP